MLPLLTYPLALIGLAALPALAAIYVLRNRFRRRPVSSLMLWQLQERSKEGGVKVQQVQLPFIFFLELLILALLVTAATGPQWRVAGNLRPLIVILDDSISMLARQPGGTPRERAIRALEALFQREDFLTIRLILAGSEPRLLGGSMRTPAEAVAALKNWHCQSPTSATDAAIALGADLGKGQALLLVLGDQIPPEESGREGQLQWWAFGESLSNHGFINASRTAHGEGDRVMLELKNFSREPVRTSLRISAGEKLLRQSPVELEAGASQRLVLNLAAGTGLVRAELGEDALAGDNRVDLLPPIRQRVRVSVRLRDDELRGLINRTLEATGLRAAVDANPELVVHDSPGLPAGTNAWSLRLRTGETSQAHSGPFVVDTSHPLTRGLALEGSVWSALPGTNQAGELPLIATANQPLLTVAADLFGRQQIVLNLVPQQSTVPQTPNWPILFWNLLSWRRLELPGLEDINFRPGSDVRIRTGGEFVEVKRPDGTVERINVGERQIIVRGDWPGLYRVQAAEGEWDFSVNLLSPGESDLQPAKSGQWGEWKTAGESRREYASMLWLFLLLALSGMGLHLFLLTHSRARV